MHRAAAFVLFELPIKHMGASGEHRDHHAGPAHFYIALNMIQPVLHYIDHIGGRDVGADPPAARHIGAHVVCASKIGVEADDFGLSTQARTIGKQLRFDLFATPTVVFGMKDRTDTIFAGDAIADTCSGEIPHPLYGCFTSVAGTSHCFDLVGALDRTGFFHRLFAIHSFEAFAPPARAILS